MSGDGGHTPWRMVRLFVEKPWVVIGLSIFTILFTFGTSALFSFALDTTSNAFRVQGTDISLDFDAIRGAVAESHFQVVTAEPSLESSGDTIYMVYISKDKSSNILTEDNMKIIAGLEASFREVTNFDEFCLRDAGTTDCSQWSSVASIFHPSTGVDPTFSSAIAILEDTGVYGITLRAAFLGSDFEDGETIAIRTPLVFGSPLPGFDTAKDRELDQLLAFRSWAAEKLYPLLVEINNTDLDFHVAYVGSGVTNEEVQEMIIGDSALATVAFLFVLGYASFHTGNFMLTALGMFHVISSFPLAYFMYRVVLQAATTNVLLGMSFFVLLGIGADDIFIVVDSFVQTEEGAGKKSALQLKAMRKEELNEYLVARFAHSYPHAVSSMLITSLTTAVSFFTNALSPIPPIQYFGIFVGFLVVFNYLLVITWFPAIIVVMYKSSVKSGYGDLFTKDPAAPLTLFQRLVAKVRGKSGSGTAVETIEMESTNGSSYGVETPLPHTATAPVSRHYEEAMPASPGGLRKKDNGLISGGEAQFSDRKGLEDEGGRKKNSREVDITTTHGVASGSTTGAFASPGVEGENLRFLERVMSGPFFNFITKYKWPVTGVFVVIAAIFTGLGATIQPAEDPAKFLPDDSSTQISLEALLDDTFATSSTIVTAHISFGVTGIVDGSLDPLNPDILPTPVYDSSFDPSSADAQDFFISVCEAIEALPEVMSGTEQVDCPMRKMKAYHGGVLPTNMADFTVAAKDWVASLSANTDPSSPLTLVTLDAGTEYTVRFDDETDELVFMQIIANLEVSSAAAAAVTRTSYEAFEELLTEWKPNAPSGLSGSMAQSGSRWLQMETEEALLSSAISGAIISFAFVFVLLVVASRNLVSASLTCLAVLGAVMVVIGSMVAYGWSLGVIESVCLTLAVGISVDIPAHIGFAYMESGDEANRRGERAMLGLRSMGISVFGAGLTTCGSSVVLLFTRILLFVQFGMFMLTAMVASMFWGIMFLSTTLIIAGPEAYISASGKNLGSKGDIHLLWLKMRGQLPAQETTA